MRRVRHRKDGGRTPLEIGAQGHAGVAAAIAPDHGIFVTGTLSAIAEYNPQGTLKESSVVFDDLEQIGLDVIEPFSGNDICVDSTGNAYVAGSIYQADRWSAYLAKFPVVKK